MKRCSFQWMGKLKTRPQVARVDCRHQALELFPEDILAWSILLNYEAETIGTRNIILWLANIIQQNNDFNLNHYEHLYGGQGVLPSVSAWSWCELMFPGASDLSGASVSFTVHGSLPPGQGGPRSASLLQGHPSRSTSHEPSFSWPARAVGALGCPFVGGENRNHHCQKEGSATRLTSLNQWRANRPTASPSANCEDGDNVMWVTEQRRMARTSKYSGMKVKQSTGATLCLRRLDTEGHSGVLIPRSRGNGTMSLVLRSGVRK